MDTYHLPALASSPLVASHDLYRPFKMFVGIATVGVFVRILQLCKCEVKLEMAGLSIHREEQWAIRRFAGSQMKRFVIIENALGSRLLASDGDQAIWQLQ